MCLCSRHADSLIKIACQEVSNCQLNACLLLLHSVGSGMVFFLLSPFYFLKEMSFAVSERKSWQLWKMYLIWIWNLENYFDDIIFYDDLKKKEKKSMTAWITPKSQNLIIWDNNNNKKTTVDNPRWIMLQISTWVGTYISVQHSWT